LELTLARLIRLVGDNNVGSPELIDTHRPDAFRIKRFIVKRERKKRTRRRIDTQSSILNPRSVIAASPRLLVSSSLLGFRVFRPPLRAKVESPNGWPVRITARAEAGRSIRGKIVRLAGPWRTSGDWWSADGWARDEWDVTVVASETSREKGTLYRIYHDQRSDGWFVEGIYD